MRVLASAILTALSLAAWGEESELRLPASSTPVISRQGKAVRYPFGDIVLPVDTTASSEDDLSRPVGRPKAENRGVFRLTYRLEKDGDAVRARDVSVRVTNRQVFHETPHRRLREHEAVHARINRSAARRLERELSGFRAEGLSLPQAEAALKRRFRDSLDVIRKEHDAWDATDVFPADPAPDRR